MEEQSPPLDLEHEWEMAAGGPCGRCGERKLRFRNGVCWDCAIQLDEQAERAQLKAERVRRFAKAHNARIDRNKRGKPQGARTSSEPPVA